ncbi:MAG: hypothetical protein KBA31_07100 [Alphaproteobacteria bacterium]|nr:hypothetical protein [Alphaproteobacteria bacterium]
MNHTILGRFAYLSAISAMTLSAVFYALGHSFDWFSPKGVSDIIELAGLKDSATAIPSAWAQAQPNVVTPPSITWDQLIWTDKVQLVILGLFALSALSLLLERFFSRRS